MSLHSELLEQARHLASKERRRPKQASLRSAVSAAYYALFHLLTDESTRSLISGNGVERHELRQALRRSFAHADMKQAAKSFAGGTPPVQWRQAAGTVSSDLRSVCETFVELQEARHQADYDHVRSWSRQEVLDLVQRGQHAFRAWNQAKAGRDAQTFLVALLAKGRQP